MMALTTHELRSKVDEAFEQQIPAEIGRPASPSRRRAESLFLIAVMVAGSAVLWVGVPAGAMWLAGEMTDSFGLHMPLALMIVLPGLFTVAMGLAWVNDIYLRINGLASAADRANYRRSAHGPLEPILAVCFVIALVALCLWFFLLAENPSGHVFG